ncbi:hypothetical protein FRC04_006538 [Tulasnella sp. 424]|nr:hypothetical protein FRC04_006538 [Tulasnella sp. 424]
MSRFRKPEKQLSEWEEWSLPEQSASGSRHVNGWSELEGPLNTDYGLASDGQEMSPPMRGLFAVPREYPPQSSSLQSQWDADSAAAFWAFPEAQVQSPTAAEHFESPHRALEQRPSDQSQSRASYYGGWGEDDDDRRSVASYRTARVTAQYGVDDLSGQLTELQLQQEGIERFQEGELPEEDEEWHKLCPESAREALDKKEVQRQSVIFEVIKSERDYVLDMQMVEQVFVHPLLSADPPIVDELESFIKDVFSNISDVEKIHEGLLASLFERQRGEHPVVTSISDLVLDASFGFPEPYDIYIKNYPIAEGRHRKELKINQEYSKFIQKCSQDTRIKKRDLISLLTRPVTRLPRLSLILEHCLKLTPPGHPDLETIPLILGVLEGLVKATQPGIAAAESKVKVRNLIESLVFERGELIDLDPSDENRSMIYQGSLARQNVKGWELDRHGWVDITVSVLDHYVIMTRPEVRAGVTRNVVTSRPIPLDFLRLGSFSLPAETRKVDDEGRTTKKSILGIGKIFKDNSIPVYPFMINHASLHSKRRYTLYASSEGIRRKWRDAFDEAMIIRRTQQDANRLFVIENISDTFFRSITTLVPATSPLRKSPTGRLTTAARFSVGGRSCLVAGCDSGIYLAYAGPDRKFRKVIDLANPPALAALEKQGQLLVVHGGGLLAFPLDDIVKAMDIEQPVSNTILKRLDNGDGPVTLLQVGTLNERIKGFRQQTVHTLEPVGGQLEMGLTPTPTAAVRSPITYRRYGTPFFVPKDASSLTVLKRTVVVAADHQLVVVDPNAAPNERRVLTVPDFSACGSGSGDALTTLKNMAMSSTPLGVIWASDSERLVLYDTFGTYVSKFGYPTRNRTYVRWETKVNSWAIRGPHILLFSFSGWIEIRHISTGKLVQVEEAPEVRMLQIAEPNNGALLLAIRGKDDKDGLADRLVEMLETSPLEIPHSPGASSDPQWREWDI